MLKKKGLLAKPTHKNIIRLAPPLTITEEQIDHVIDIFKTTVRELPTMPAEAFLPGDRYDVNIDN